MASGSDLRIAVLPGDGIGVEVMDACLTVLGTLSREDWPALRMAQAARRREPVPGHRQRLPGRVHA